MSRPANEIKLFAREGLALLLPVVTTANKITIVRILMIPVFVTLAIYYGQSIQRGAPLEWQRFAAIIVFLLAAASDGLDGYVARRYNELDLSATNPVGYISVEKSDGYPNLRKGYYIALAAICNSQEAAKTELLKFSGFVPKAYIAKTEIYMGCIH